MGSPSRRLTTTAWCLAVTASFLPANSAAAAPDPVGSASLTLSTGQDTTGTADLLARHGLDLVSAVAKAPVGKSGEVYTLWFNDFERFGGTVGDKLERAVGKARLRHLQQAGTAPQAQQAGLRELATADIRITSVTVAAPKSTLTELGKDPAISGVAMDSDPAKVTALYHRRAAFAASQRIQTTAEPVRLVSGDPASSTTTASTPVTTSTGQVCAWARADAVLSCQGADPAAFGTGASTAPSFTPLASNAWTDCGVPSNTEGCPNDFTYSPRPQTSGSQSFAVLVNAYPPGTIYFYDCYYVWVPANGGSPNDGGSWQTVCYVYSVTSNGFTYGAAGWRSTWGRQTTTVAPNVTKPISTLAFKASGLKRCTVRQFLATAHCDASDQNAIYVPNPGIEDELLIDNPACTGADRNGDTSDWDRGCFYPTYAASNLPSPYLDTTFGDHAGDPYDLAVGSSNPAAIAEGTPYTSYAEFFSYRFNNMLGRHAWHDVSVDSRVTLSTACQYGTIVRGQPEAFCFFPVDAVRISEKATFTAT